MPQLKPAKELFFYGSQILKAGPSEIWRFIQRMISVGPKRYFYVKPRPNPPDCLLDPSLGEHGYVQLKKHKLHYVANGKKGRPLMLFVHGFPETWYSWRYQLHEFGKDYRAVAIDMRGYGDSDSFPAISDYHLDELVEDIRGVIDSLGYKDCVLVGHDWGGIVCWRTAEIFPEKIRKLVICNVSHYVAFTKHVRDSKIQQQKSKYVFHFQLPWLAESMMRAEDFSYLVAIFCSKKYGMRKTKLDRKDIEAFKYYFSKTGFGGPVNYYRALVRYDIKTPANGHIIRVPTLVLWGTADEHMEANQALTSIRDHTEVGELQYFDGISHWIQQDDPENVNQHIHRFLAVEHITPKLESKL